MVSRESLIIFFILIQHKFDHFPIIKQVFIFIFLKLFLLYTVAQIKLFKKKKQKEILVYGYILPNKTP